MNASSDRLLRRTLWGNAASPSSRAQGSRSSPGRSPGPPRTLRRGGGLDFAIVLELLGLGVIAFGALCAWVARARRCLRPGPA